MKKNILLIGGSHGIGLEIVTLLKDSHNLFIASRTADEIADLPVTHITFDVSKDELDLNQLPEELHGFVYCPGSINLKPIKMMDLEAFRADMEINFFSLVRTVKKVLPKMAENSSIVFFSTVAVAMGMPFHTSVSAAKGAIEGFSKALAAEYTPRIRVNVIAPSLVDTPLASRLLSNDRKKEMMAERHPLKRVGTAQDIAHMAVFLLKEDSSWMTGQVLGVDGGMSSLNIS